MSEQAGPTIYRRVGGIDAFRRLTSEFYDRVEQDPLLRPMFEEATMEEPKERLALFLCMYFGGPLDYVLKRGAPMLPFRHARFAIGRAERDAWVRHMTAALEVVGIEEPLQTEMRESLARTATFLINRPEQSKEPSP